MATFEQHCAETVARLGAPWECVHRWLDELQPTLGPTHRAVRHNAAGIEQIRERWGEEAAEAARIHIARDEGGFVLSPGGVFVRPDPDGGAR